MDFAALARDLAPSIEQAAREAGRLALAYFRGGERTRAAVTAKEGGSPVTEADHAADRFLRTTLGALLPQAGWLSEETPDTPDRLAAELVFIVDPIDGTRNFVAGDPAWAVSVALVARGRPIVGIVEAPALAETYGAVAGAGATCNGSPIAVSRRPALTPESALSGPKFLARDLEAAGLRFALQPRVGSLALRIVRVASGALEAGVASRDAHDWDLAAADLVLAEAGGVLAGFDGAPLIYNRPDTRHSALTVAPRQLHPALNAALRRAKSA